MHFDRDRTQKHQTSEAPKKLETPLAAMLPSKYANTNVTELFPDFRPDKVSYLNVFVNLEKKSGTYVFLSTYRTGTYDFSHF